MCKISLVKKGPTVIETPEIEYLRRIMEAAVKWSAARRQKEWTDDDVYKLCGKEAADLMISVRKYLNKG